MRFYAILLILFLAPFNQALAANATKLSLPPILKADKIDANQVDNVIKATGHVELTKDKNIILSDIMYYDKKNNFVDVKGDVRVLNRETGNLLATDAHIKDDLTAGYLNNATLVFAGGAYMKSPKITKVSEVETILQKPVYSICPNDTINDDNKSAGNKRDVFSIKSSKTTINKDKNSIQIINGRFRIYDVPVFYVPYISFPIPARERKSGFLNPSYTSNEKLGAGVIVPYYVNIAPNKDLTVTTQYHPENKSYIVNNTYRHLLKEGEYEVQFEFANNKIESSNTSSGVSTKDDRWHGSSNGDFELSDNVGLEFSIDHVSDKDYLRDYKSIFLGHTISTADLNYIKDRDYFSLKTVKIQELETARNEKEQPFALPILNSYIESKPGSINQKYALTTNFTAISRNSGLQYRRMSFNPEVIVPYNLKGNLFEVAANVQSDLYDLENNFTTTTKDNNYDDNQLNYSPQISLNWSLPLIKRMKSSSIMIEPRVNAVYSTTDNNFNAVPNEDSNGNELTPGNLFLKDRFVGFDRNESGKRMNYGVNSSLFTPIGDFGLGLGQGYRVDSKEQDVKLAGFNRNGKSNLVGEISYRSEKIFHITYNFQLDESNYNNEINEIGASVNFDRVSFGTGYLLLKENDTNSELREQIAMSGSLKITNRWTGDIMMTQDLVTGKIISKKYGVVYDGCCARFEFAVSEANLGDFIEPEVSYNVVFVIKDL